MVSIIISFLFSVIAGLVGTGVLLGLYKACIIAYQLKYFSLWTILINIRFALAVLTTVAVTVLLITLFI